MAKRQVLRMPITLCHERTVVPLTFKKLYAMVNPSFFSFNFLSSSLFLVLFLSFSLSLSTFFLSLPPMSDYFSKSSSNIVKVFFAVTLPANRYFLPEIIGGGQPGTLEIEAMPHKFGHVTYFLVSQAAIFARIFAYPSAHCVSATA